ncbi:hypothetical protein SAMN05428989_1605 [Pseudoxanthomonas sp. GM95]|uniref:hypothetical protein n=1 Tax=Pseudoxanthomonas sp. GM95 TaxID=1881043 RepID=UPI0008C067D5|nr:hypothetical protein [Pseudoxanthomonas sp. GM95]SEL17341.1 hypothetical protein SAMN05428989_1605 [Pseudoxanthomonas sp. GM95]
MQDSEHVDSSIIQSDRVFTVAICVSRQGQCTLLYVGKAIETPGQAWLVLEWDRSGMQALKRLPLTAKLLQKHPPVGHGVEANWTYIVPMPRPKLR